MPPRSKSQFLWTVAAFGLAALLLYLVLRGVSWSEVASILSRARIPPLAAAFGLGSLAYALRALRWKIVLTAAANLEFSAVFWASSAGYLGNSFLPARAGEVIRSAMVSARSDLSKTYVLTTALAERAVDLAVLLALSSAVVLISGKAPAALLPAGAVMLGLALTVVVVLFLVPRTERFWRMLVQQLWLPERWRAWLLRMLEQVVLGMLAFHHWSRLARFVALTVCVWCADAYGATLVARSLGMHLPLEAAFVLLAGLALGSTVPSTPGYVGVFQFVTVTVLYAYGIGHSAGLTYSLVLQAASYAVITFWGVIGICKFRSLQQVHAENPLVPVDAHRHAP